MSLSPPSSGLFVGGSWQQAPRTFERHNPAFPDRLIGTFAVAEAGHVDDAYAAAGAAAAAWRRTPAPARGRFLHLAANEIEQELEPLARELSEEEGKTLPEARGEVGRGVAVLRYFAAAASQPTGELFASAQAGSMLYSVREPVGVVAIITPWNFPTAIPLWKLAPALVYGNAVVWKPSELSPRCAVRIVEAFDRAGLPAGVLNLVTGEPAVTGPAVAGHPGVARISFTGSLAVGRRIKADAALRGVEVQAELGGKNPVIVLADADLDLAVEATVSGAMLASGQKCSSTSRALVVPEIHDAFVERLVARVEQLKVGDPLADGVNLGPVVSRSQLRRIHSYLEIGRADGLEMLTGDRDGALPGESEGHFVAPTVYADVPPDSTLAREEIFGPVLAVMRVADHGEALERANDTEFGLSASIFTRDIGAALRFVDEIEAGMVHVNSETPGAEPHAPFGGIKASGGVAREQGRAAEAFFTRGKTVSIAPGS